MAAIDQLSLSQAGKSLSRHISHGVKSNDTIYLIQHIRDLFYTKDAESGDVAYEVHTICRSLIFSNQAYLGVYARPGMTSYLLSPQGDDLLNEKKRFVRTRAFGWIQGGLSFPCVHRVLHCGS
jgi:hypothetical protein